MEPVLDELARSQASRMKVRKIHVDKEPDTVEKYNVTSLGTSVFISPDGEEYTREWGFLSREEILEIINEIEKSESSGDTENE